MTASVRLLAPWAIGQIRVGWPLVDAQPCADRAGAVRVIFRRAGIEAQVQVAPRNDEFRAYSRTKRYDLHYRADSVGPVPEQDLARLMRAVRELTRRNEATAADATSGD